jgi:general secretion pathway protein B
MSFILDALKKSEAERNRQSGPVLMDVRIAPPRRRLPVWALVLTGVLIANLAFLVYVLSRGSSAPPAFPAPAPVSSAAATPAAAAPAAVPSAVPAPSLPVAAPQATSPLDAGPLTAPASRMSPDDRPAVASSDADIADLPTSEDLKLSGTSVPEFRLSLLAYDAVPANRYVLMNSAKLREGDGTPEGATVVRIMATGVVLSWHGQRFILKASQ